MRQYSGAKNVWNLFARELKFLLCARGRDLNDLVSEAGLHESLDPILEPFDQANAGVAFEPTEPDRP